MFAAIISVFFHRECYNSAFSAPQNRGPSHFMVRPILIYKVYGLMVPARGKCFTITYNENKHVFFRVIQLLCKK